MDEKPFLTARWSNLLLVTYAIGEESLRLRLPDGLELDTIDGTPFVSLVAFDFQDTKVKGVKWPGFVNFPEINLRFYVREPNSGRRGVCFIRELVPSRAIARIARSLYNEPYQFTKMQSSVHDNGQFIMAQHDWDWNKRAHRLRVSSNARPFTPKPDSREHFFKEHQWGFGSSKKGETLIYEVRHPHWEVYPVRSYTVDVDFGTLYGAEFAALNDAKPYSVVHAVGSEIEVYPHRDLAD
jgi:uncharacterized protein YqjF (DUF2071 family)